MNVYVIEAWQAMPAATKIWTKFGGLPEWLTTPQWPVSGAWEDRPMKFLGQIRMDQFQGGYDRMTIAYLFMTQPDDREDDFYDPDIIFPFEGENAVVIKKLP